MTYTSALSGAIFLLIPLFIQTQEAQLEKSVISSLENRCIQVLVAKNEKAWDRLIGLADQNFRPNFIALCLRYLLLTGGPALDLTNFIYAYNDPLMRAKIITNILLSPRLNKKTKLTFLKFLEENASSRGGSFCDPETEYSVITFFRILLAQKNVVNVEGFMVKRRLYMAQAPDGRLFFLNSNHHTYGDLPLSNVEYCSPLMTDAIKQANFLLIEALTQLGTNLQTKDVPTNEEMIVARQKGGSLKMKSGCVSALDHAACGFNPRVMPFLLNLWKEKSLRCVQPRFLFQAFLQQPNNLQPEGSLQCCLATMDLLKARNLLDLQSALHELLSDTSYGKEQFRGIMTWLLEQGAPLSPRTLEIAFINDYQEYTNKSVLRVVVPLLQRYDILNRLPKSAHGIITACAIVTEDLNYLSALSPEDLEIQFSLGKDDTTFSLFHLAALYGNVNVMRVLVEKDAEGLLLPDNLEDVPLHIACENGHKGLVRYLMSLHDREIDIGLNALDMAEHTPLDSAVIHGHVELVPLLNGDRNKRSDTWSFEESSLENSGSDKEDSSAEEPDRKAESKDLADRYISDQEMRDVW